MLSVLTMLIGLLLPAYRVLEEQQEEQRFFELLLADLHFMQSRSYGEGAWTQLSFNADGSAYTVQQNYSVPLLKRTLPPFIRMNKASNLKNIQYGPNGSVSASGTMLFTAGAKERRLVVHLGKGRVVLSE